MASCTISGATVTFVAVGNCVIDANQAGNANYEAATQVQQSFAVGMGSQTTQPTLTTAPTATSVTLATTAPTLKDSATLSGAYDPTGTVTFTLYRPE